jgi:hypothetical protein
VNYSRKLVTVLVTLVGLIVLAACETGEVGNGAKYPATSPTGEVSSTSANVPKVPTTTEPLMMTWDKHIARDHAMAACPENSPNPDYPVLVSEERQRCIRAELLRICPNYMAEDDPGWFDQWTCNPVPVP